MTLANEADIRKNLATINKLGAFFRAHFADWKIVLRYTGWHEEETCFVREIEHTGGGKILAYAKVEVPKETFLHFQTDLLALGERSIGDHFLFVKEATREPFQIFQTQTGEWAREARYHVEGYPLTITEYFTPEGMASLCQG